MAQGKTPNLVAKLAPSMLAAVISPLDQNTIKFPFTTLTILSLNVMKTFPPCSLVDFCTFSVTSSEFVTSFNGLFPVVDFKRPVKQ